MKSVITAVLLTFLICGETLAQPRKGYKEVSTSPSFWSVSAKDEDESQQLVNIPVRVGYFVTSRLEIEPEFILTIPEEGEETGILVMGNLAFNFPTEDKVYPFFLVGIGFGNGVNVLSLAVDQDMSITAFNFGMGLKASITSSVALRTEYRFTHYSGEKEKVYYSPYYYHYRHEVDMNIHNFQMGFSIFLK
jgi:hypothetical protein